MVKKKSGKKNSVSVWLRAHKFTAVLMALVVVVAGIFAYNKILDRQNVQDMKELLAAFEQLEQDVEADTGDQLTIEADCGSVGKFAESYGCSIYLLNSGKDSLIYETRSLTNFKNCRTVPENDSKYSKSYYCSLMVRQANKSKAESIFYQYDISPGRAF